MVIKTFAVRQDVGTVHDENDPVERIVAFDEAKWLPARWSARRPPPLFDAWFNETLVETSPQKRLQRLLHRSSAPSARVAHPRDEDHLIPLMVAAGAAGYDAGARVDHQHNFLGSITASSYRFGDAVVRTSRETIAEEV